MPVFPAKQLCSVSHRLIEIRAALFISVLLLGLTTARATLLMEEGFNYTPGSNLAANFPWAGSSGSTLSIAEGNLSLPNLRATTPAGNMLRSGGGGRINYRPFTSAAITSGALYGSFLLNVVTTPTNSQFVAALLASGTTSPNQPDDPLDLYIVGTGTGYTFEVGHTGNDPIRVNAVLSSNATHLIAFKYAFASPGRCSIYFDPTPGQSEPAPNAITINEGSPTSTLQNPLLNAGGASALYYIDSVRIGTAWADVVPIPNPLTVVGPADQTVCAGNPAQFTINVAGTAPFTYQWRTNGSPIAGATQSFYTLNTPTLADTTRGYDVVVHDSFGAITSRVATLAINSAPPTIVRDPRNQFVPPGASTATFSVQAAGQSLNYYWRSNSISIANATNSSLTILNPQTSDASISYDVIVGNACGSLTSSPASIVFLHQFLPADGIPAFFGGMNLFTTNGPAQTLYAWSSADPTVPIANWNLEGQLGEQPLNDGTGDSRYSINVNPTASVMYYVVGQTVAPPYLQPIAVERIFTDIDGNYTITTANQFVVSPPLLGARDTSTALEVTAVIDPGVIYLVQTTADITPPILWTTVATNTTDSSGLIQFTAPLPSSSPAGFYRVAFP